MSEPLGGPVPPNTAHAVSVSLPTWKATVGYEEGEDWVVNKMKVGYPRFFIHESIQKLSEEIVRRFGYPNEEAAMLFPSRTAATVCEHFISSRVSAEESKKIRILNFAMSPELCAAQQNVNQMFIVTSKLSCVLYPKAYASIAKQVWQHSGSGISSRRSEFCQKALEDGYLVEESKIEIDRAKAQRLCKGPKRYQKNGSMDSISRASTTTASGNSDTQLTEHTAPEGREYAQFIEERFGRNLSTAFAKNAKTAVRRRIAGSLTANVDLNEALETEASDSRISGLTENDVFLYPNGMNSIFSTHQALMAARGEMNNLKSICFGFPYIDTLKILEKWGPGCLFYGNGSSKDLDDLERRLASGEKYLALFTEFPGNPLLDSPDLARIQSLASKYDFAVVVDETVGNFINVNVLPHADIVVSSLTKIFSGDSNVMGGSAVLNPHSRYYQLLKDTFAEKYEDEYWVEDAVFLERNSRDFVSRIERSNATTEAITELLKASPLVKNVYYPKYNSSRPLYDKFRNANGGYGGLFSVTFHSPPEAVAFFDALDIMKGPSLGTNFTLGCPYTLLAHYGELQWASSFGVDFDLVRISVGLEDPADLENRIQNALEAVKSSKASEYQ